MNDWANRPVYAAIGVTVDGRKDVLGPWMGTGGEGAKFWMSLLVDLKNRGVADAVFLVCDGLKGLPEVVANVWPQTIVRTCIVHLIRNTFQLTSRRDRDRDEFVPFLDYDIEIRKMIRSTNAVVSLNARYRRDPRGGVSRPNRPAMKCLYLVTRSLDPTGTGRARWTMRWLSRPAARCQHCCRSVRA